MLIGACDPMLFPIHQGDAKNEAEGKLREAQQKKEEWNGGKKDHFYNEHRGFPDGKPPARDNIKILGLYGNFDMDFVHF